MSAKASNYLIVCGPATTSKRHDLPIHKRAMYSDVVIIHPGGIIWSLRDRRKIELRRYGMVDYHN